MPQSLTQTKIMVSSQTDSRVRRSGCLGPSRLSRNKIAKMSNAHFPIQIRFSALWVKRCTPFFDLRQTHDPLAPCEWVISMTLTTVSVHSRRCTWIHLRPKDILWCHPQTDSSSVPAVGVPIFFVGLTGAKNYAHRSF